MSTTGALLPPGYQKSDNPHFPWRCPVRSCRKLFTTLSGLGRHFCVSRSTARLASRFGAHIRCLTWQNSHRAARLNDNMDGTFSDLGQYVGAIVGDGRNSGGFAKPPIVVSKKPMSLVESPMVEPREYPIRPTVPQRGGPRRSQTADAASDGADGHADSENDAASRVSISESNQRLSPPAGGDKVFTMANPDRPYNMWPGKCRCLLRS